VTTNDQFSRREFLAGSLAAVSTGVAGCSGGSEGTPTRTPDLPFERDVDPSRTYLRTRGDDAGDARPVELPSLGIGPGVTIVLERRGRFTGSSGGTGMTAVFSESATLAPADTRNRVVDAVDAGPDYETSATFEGDAETDVPEDFLVADNEGEQTGVTVTVPDDATHLFVAAIDNFYQDNAHGATRFGLVIRTAE
jgi:hypothetical protein